LRKKVCRIFLPAGLAVLFFCCALKQGMGAWTGDVYTYWDMLNDDDINLDTHDKEAGSAENKKAWKPEEVTEEKETEADTQKISEETEENNNLNAPEKSETGKKMFTAYQTINSNILEENFLEEIREGLSKDQVFDYAEEAKSEFVPVVPTDSSIPEGLIVTLEKAFYNCDNSRLRNMEHCSYDETLKELGAEEFSLSMEEAYELFPKIGDYKEQIEDKYQAYDYINELYLGETCTFGCNGIYHFHLTKGQDNYVFAFSSGGSAICNTVLIMERTGDTLVEKDMIITPSFGRARVIQYEEKFYYIIMEFDDSLKDYNGICIYSLTDNSHAKSLSIRYLPEKYLKKTFYSLNDRTAEKIDSYLKDIEGEFAPDKQVFYGDEKKGEFIEYKDSSIDRGETAYKMDIANCNLPVYIRKSTHVPACCSKYLKVMFLFYSEDKIYELGGLSLGQPEQGSDINLVQMWFKEFDGLVYTFRVYHVSDYSYILDVVLLEKDRLTKIQTYLLSPQKKFVVMED